MPEAGEFRPVFIMGHHRSGTTILYKVLAETGLFNVVTAYHVLYHERLLALHAAGGELQARNELSRRFEGLGLKDREFDSMRITPDIPEEYAWVLDHQGRRPRLRPANLEGFLRFCRALTTTQDPARPLLLKNPFDAANFLYMGAALPEARFVYIHRDPVEVVNSQVRAVRSLLSSRNEYVALVVRRYRRLYERPLKLAVARFLYSDRFPLLVTQVAHNVSRTNDHFLRGGGDLGDRCFNLTYDGLCSAPGRTTSRMLDFLGMRDLAAGRDYGALVKRRDTGLLPEVETRRGRIRARNSAYCSAFGV